MMFDRPKVVITAAGDIIASPWRNEAERQEAFKEASRPLAELLGQPESLVRLSRSFPGLEDDTGIFERRPVQSRHSKPGHRYSMVRTAGGWQHEHADCDGWTVRGRCGHVSDLNKETGMETSLVPRGNALAVIEELDDQAIIAGISGQITKEWIYEFPQDGQTVRGLSVNGVEEAARELGKHGEAVREMDVRCEYEDDREARFVARAGRYAVDGEGHEVLLDVAIRAKRQPKFIALRNGGEKFNESWFETGIAKAVRNAKEALLPESIKAVIIAKAVEVGRVGRLPQERPQVQAPPRPAPPLPSPGPEQPPTRAFDVRAETQSILMEIKDTFPPGDYALVRGTIEAEWPETVSGSKFYPNRVSDEHAEELLDYVRRCRQYASATPPDEEPPGDEEPEAEEQTASLPFDA